MKVQFLEIFIQHIKNKKIYFFLANIYVNIRYIRRIYNGRPVEDF